MMHIFSIVNSQNKLFLNTSKLIIIPLDDISTMAIEVPAPIKIKAFSLHLGENKPQKSDFLIKFEFLV